MCTHKHLYPIVLSSLLLITASCDFTAAEDAFNDFGIVIELPPINTVVSGKILNAYDGEAVTDEMTLTFGGSNGGDLIDIFSDPISSVIVKDGYVSFGIDNSVAPTIDNPAEFTISVELPGFQPRTKLVRLMETGDGDFTLRLVSDDPTQAPLGAAGTRNTSVSSSNGTVASASTVTTPPTANNNKTASVVLNAGTVIRDASGAALTGQITTDLTVYDNSAQSLQSLPDEAKVTDTGDPISISGAVRLKMVDSSGKVAARFSTGSGKSAGHCSGASVTIGVTDADGTVVTIYAVNVSTRALRVVGTATVTGGEVHACLGTGGFDPNSLGAAPSGILYSVGIPGTSCSTNTTVSVNTSGWTGQMPVEVTKAGVSYAGAFSSTVLGVGPIPLSNVVATVPTGTYTAKVYAPDRSVSGSATFDPCGGGSHTITVPAPSNRITSAITVRPSCASGKKVRVTGSLSGLKITYTPVPNPNFADPITVSTGDVTINTTATEFQNALVNARNVSSGQQARFVVVLGRKSSVRTVTFAPQLTLTDVTDLNDLCQ